MAEDDDLLARFIGKSLAAEIRGSVPESRPVLDPCNSQRLDAARAKRNPDTYDKETFQIFRQNESKFRADPCYMERQVNITHEMRNETISWMVEIADYVGISRTSLFLSVNFFDRFLSMCSTTKNNLQLVAVTCMFIAGKIEKGENAASVGDYVYLTDGAYIGDQILRLEKLILKKLQFSLYAPTIDWFCTELLNVCKADDKLKYMTMYLAEVTMLDASYIGASPSLIAAASLVLARHYVGLPVWTMELWEISSYLPNDNLLCINYIAETCAFYRNIDDPSLQGILRKYSAQKYLEIANIQTFPEQDFDSLQRKCREFGTAEFISPSRSHSRRVRYNKFNRRDTPMTYDPSAKQLPFFKARMKREYFEGYAAETYRIMLGLENKYRASQAYVNRQTNIDISLRQEEVNWMMWFIEDKKFTTSSFLLAVNLLDRVLSLRSVPREKLRLVTVTCLFIMRKFESMDINIIDTFLKAVEYIYRKQEIIYMQMTILKLLDFHLMAPTAAWFADELLDVCEADDTLRALTGYLLELTTLQMRYLQYRPSQIGATALFVARYSLGLRPWTKKLLERSGYKLKDSLGCLRSLYDDYKMSQFQAEFLQYKYRKLEYMEVSDFTKYPVPDIFYLLDFYFREMDKARNH